MSSWELGLAYYQRGYYHAANEAWLKALSNVSSPSLEVRIANGIGWIFSKNRWIDEALHWYGYAENKYGWDKLTVDDRIRTTNNIAQLHARRSDFDLALQTQVSILDLIEHADPTLQAIYYVNLTSYRYCNQMYKEMVSSAKKTIDVMEEHGLEHLMWGAYTNLGLAYMELGELVEAEKCFMDAWGRQDPPPLQLVVEVSRLYRLMDKRDLCFEFSRKASDRLFSEGMSVELGEYAALLSVFGYLSLSYGDVVLAKRFFEKAELHYGAYGMWQEWQEMQDLQRSMLLQQPHLTSDASPVVQALRDQYEIFNVYDSMVSQYPSIGRIADFAGPFAKALGEVLGLSAEDQKGLLYAYRLQYFGWTTLGEDIIKKRLVNDQAAKRYEQHPRYAADFLQMFPVPSNSVEAIRWQLSSWDEQGTMIPQLARILAVVSSYVLRVVEEGRDHSTSLQLVQQDAGRRLDPDIVEQFIGLFDVNV